MGRRIAERNTLVTGVATYVTSGLRVTDFKNCVLSIAGSASADLKVFVKGAIGDVRPTSFSTASALRAANNLNWDYIEVVDMEDGAAIDGDTGIALSGNVIRLVEVNINALDWLAIHVTNRAAGTVTVSGLFATD